MSVRMTIGSVTVEVDQPDAADAFLRGLLRHLNNQEVAHLLGVTDKTVRRWQRAGRLPNRPGGQTLLLDLYAHMGPAQGWTLATSTNAISGPTT